MNDALRKTLKQLRLSGLLESLEIRLQEAAGHGLSHSEFLELILQDELAVRSDRQLQRRFKAAQFRERKSLEDFDWSFNPSIPRKQVYDLASCRFLREGRDVLWLGPHGVGKSFLVQAIGYQAIKAGYTVSVSGKEAALPPPPPLRTARDSFPSGSSSLHERPWRDAAALVRCSRTWICR
jgi:DNA replication protein DnaC